MKKLMWILIILLATTVQCQNEKNYSELPTTTNLNPADLIPNWQNGTTKAISWGNMINDMAGMSLTISGTWNFYYTINGSISGNAGSVTNGVYTHNTQSITGEKTFVGDVAFSCSQLSISTDTDFFLPIQSSSIAGGALGIKLDGTDYVPVFGTTWSQEDTIITRNDLRTRDWSANGDWTTSGTWHFEGSPLFNYNAYFTDNLNINGSQAFIDFAGGGKFILNTMSYSGSESISMYKIDATRDLIGYTYDNSGNRDTVASRYHVRDYITNNDLTFKGENTQTDVLHQGYISYPVTSTTMTLNGNSNHYELTTPVTSFSITSFAVSGVQRGDVIVIVNKGNYTVTFNDTAPFNLSAGITLGTDDTVMLYYDGTKYLQLGTSNN
jgi:hypothetical protein